MLAVGLQYMTLTMVRHISSITILLNTLIMKNVEVYPVHFLHLLNDYVILIPHFVDLIYQGCLLMSKGKLYQIKVSCFDSG